MNSKKLLTLSATLLMMLTVASCGKKNNDTSSSLTPASSSEVASSEEETPSSEVDAEALWNSWAESVWDLYKEKDGTQITGSFDVATVAATRNDDGDLFQAKVHFALSVEGSTDAFELKAKDDTHKTVYVGYYDGKVTAESTVKITISIEYNGVTKTISEILGNDKKGTLTFTTPVLVMDDHDAWKEWSSTDDEKKNKVYNIKGIVIDVIGEGSSSKGSFYMVDSEGYGYYVYKPTGESPVAGDEVIVTGKRSDYSGQEEFASGASFTVVKKSSTSSITFKNGTEDFSKAQSASINDENLGDKYQNIPVTLEGCVPLGKSDDSHYAFKVGNGTAVFNLYDTYYFLSEEQRKAYTTVYEDAMKTGHTLTISGICVSYSNEYQIYGSTLKADEVIVKGPEMNVVQKVSVVKSNILANIEETYNANATIEFSLPEYAKVSFEVKNSDATVAVDGGKLVVTPTNRVVENTITVSINAGGDTPTTFDIKILTEDNSIEKYTGKFDYETFAIDSTETTAKVVSKNAPTQSEEITFTHSAIIDSSKYKEFTIAKKTGFITFNAPEGYTIASLELKTFKDNLEVYAGSEKGETALEKTNLVVSGSNYVYTVNVNGKSVYIANESTSYDASIYYIDVTLTKPKSGVEVVHKLTIGKDDLVILDSSQTSTYNKYKGDQTIGTYTFSISDVMPNTFGDDKIPVVQMKKSTGSLSLEGTFSKVVITIVSTYDYDDSNAISIFYGDEEFVIDSAAVNTARVDSGKMSGSYKIYYYTVVADWGEEKTGTFSIKKDTSTGTAYLSSIVFD